MQRAGRRDDSDKVAMTGDAEDDRGSGDVSASQDTSAMANPPRTLEPWAQDEIMGGSGPSGREAQLARFCLLLLRRPRITSLPCT